MNIQIFIEREANVRSYCRAFPDVFQRAKGAILYGETGKSYIDFFAGAGALNYGHNNDYIKQQLLAYLEADNIIHSLDNVYDSQAELFGEFLHRHPLSTWTRL